VQQIIDFILELDKLKSVTRKVRPVGVMRYENSAEHSWQIAMLAAALVPYADAAVDINRVIAMLLVHDIGEIDAGDTMVFVESGWEERKAAELASVTRIFGLLPEGRGAGFLELWKEFEEGKSADSLFAHAIDRAMPVLLNLSNDGQSWRENGISYERVMRRIGPEINAGCPALWTYMERRMEEVRSKGWFDAPVV
jgi:putative hydrolase of HD superfamily